MQEELNREVLSEAQMITDHWTWTERTRLLYGEDWISKLRDAHVLVVGLGGVGGCVAELLTRAGVGHLTIVDADVVQASNINRQIIASHSCIGRAKVALWADRIKDINPAIDLEIHELFLKDENIPALLDQHKYDFVVDAIDSLSPKVHLISESLKRNYSIISSMGAGAKRDPSQIKVSDISKSHSCSLARALRKRLRKLGINNGVPVVYSSELPDPNAIIEITGERCKRSTAGTISYMPMMFGCYLASFVLEHICSEKNLENNGSDNKSV